MSVVQKQAKRWGGPGERMQQGVAEKHVDPGGSQCHLLTGRTGINFFPKILQKEKVLLNYIHDLC